MPTASRHGLYERVLAVVSRRLGIDPRRSRRVRLAGKVRAFEANLAKARSTGASQRPLSVRDDYGRPRCSTACGLLMDQGTLGRRPRVDVARGRPFIQAQAAGTGRACRSWSAKRLEPHHSPNEAIPLPGGAGNVQPRYPIANRMFCC